MLTKERIKVLHLIDNFSPGGAEKMIMTLGKSIDKDKFEFHIWCGQYDEKYKKIMEESGVRVKKIKYDRFFKSVIPAIEFMVSLRKEKFSIIHTHLFKNDLIGRICGKIARIPIIITTYHTFATYKQNRREFKNKIMVLLDRITANYFTDKILAVSEIVAKLHEKIGINSKKINVLYNPVDITEFKYKYDTQDLLTKRPNENIKSIITVCRLDVVKGLQYLIESASHVCKKLENITYSVVGDGDLKGELMAKIEKRSLCNNFFLLGKKYDVNKYLQEADIFILPSLSEGVPIVILEAMAVGLPVIATNVGGIPNIVVDGKTGILISPQNVDAINEATLYLLKNDDERKRMGEEGRKRVEQLFSSNQITKQLENIYIELMNKKQML